MSNRTIKTAYTKTRDGGSRMTAKAFYNGECIRYAPKKKVLLLGYNHEKSIEENHDAIFELMCWKLQLHPLGTLPKRSELMDRYVFAPVGKWVKGQCSLVERVYIKYEHETLGLGPKPDLLEVKA